MTGNDRKRNGGAALTRFMGNEAFGGIVLMITAGLAMIAANSGFAEAYFRALHTSVGGMSVLHWINDALMAIFFMLLGLEVKREFQVGQLSTWGDRLLPGAAALAGMIVPALVFLAVNLSAPQNWAGWAIPAATDPPFALAILAVIGSRAPVSLKVLLTAIAVVDDLLAVGAIALFYTSEVSLLALGIAAVGLCLLILLNQTGVRHLAPYLIIGCGIWYAVLLSGVHPTLAGVAVAFTIPMAGRHGEGPLERLERTIHPWTAFLIVPLFGLANAGVALSGISFADVLSPLPLGVLLGLFVGKQLGIFGTIWALVRFKVARPVVGASWGHVYGLTLLCGIGFTISLFIGSLAFAHDPSAVEALKLGVFAGSILSGVGGATVLLLSGRPSTDRLKNDHPL